MYFVTMNLSAGYNYLLNIAGYIIFDELIFQWDNLSPTQVSISVTYPIAYIDTAFIILTQIVENTNSGPTYCRIENYLTTFNEKSCQFYTGHVNTATIADKVFYLSIGN